MLNLPSIDAPIYSRALFSEILVEIFEELVESADFELEEPNKC